MCRTDWEISDCLSSVEILIMSLIGNTMNKRNERHREENRTHQVILVRGSLLQCGKFVLCVCVCVCFPVIFQYSKWFCRFFLYFFSRSLRSFNPAFIGFNAQKKSYADDDDDDELIFALFGYLIWYGIVTYDFTATVNQPQRISHLTKPNKFFLYIALSISLSWSHCPRLIWKSHGNRTGMPDAHF